MSAPPPHSVVTRKNQQVPTKETLICFSHLRWDFVFQRPQHLLSRAAKIYSVLFFEEPKFEESCCAHLNVKTNDAGVTIIVPILPEGLTPGECAVTLRRLLNVLIESRGNVPEIAWYYTPMALQFTDHIKFDCVVYDCMDELSAFKGAPNDLRGLEQKLFSKSHVVFTGGHGLFEAKKKNHHNIHAFPSSIDRWHFGRARSSKLLNDPSDQRNIARPRIGFFGVIDERADLDILEKVAEQRPDYNFIMIGPVVKIDPSTLPKRLNIHWLGQKNYNDLPNYLAHWDVGFMPFAINEATQFISPTKTPEFLAAGLPIVSTPIPDVVNNWGKPGLVGIAGTAEEMVTQLDRAMQVDRSLWLKRVDQALSLISWDVTFASMLELIDQKSEVAAHTVPPRVIAGDIHV
jgi:glycosyltransferase involved in cell wall biosynthesis